MPEIYALKKTDPVEEPKRTLKVKIEYIWHLNKFQPNKFAKNAHQSITKMLQMCSVAMAMKYETRSVYFL